MINFSWLNIPFFNFYNSLNAYAFNPYFFNPYNGIMRDNSASIFQMQRHNTYNRAKGELLVQNALKGLPAQNPEIPLCARYVKNAIVNSGLGRYINGNGEQTKYMLRQNLNFREIKVSGEDLSYVPAGTVIVYDAFDEGYNKDGNPFTFGENGHTLIAKGDGTGISDRPENEIIASNNAHTFIPV